MTLVEQLQSESTTQLPSTYRGLLDNTGFARSLTDESVKAEAIPGYLYISRKSIINALSAKLTRPYFGFDEDGIQANVEEYNSLGVVKITVYADSRIGYTRHSFIWNETPISEYKGLPPIRVLQSLQRAQQTDKFKKFAVATIIERHEVPEPDPLLIGYSHGDDRYLIDWWDNDFTPEEIAQLVK